MCIRRSSLLKYYACFCVKRLIQSTGILCKLERSRMANGKLEFMNGEYVNDYEADDSFIAHQELEAIKARVREMEEEAERLKEVQFETEKHLIMSPQASGVFYPVTAEEKMDADNRSVYVGNVDYGATADELEIHFSGCGPVNRVTILCDKFSGHPKGFAYIEFSEEDSVKTAITFDETLFRGRVIKVLPKRTNVPGISTTDRGGQRAPRYRGRNFGFSRYYGGYQPRHRGRFFRGGQRTSSW